MQKAGVVPLLLIPTLICLLPSAPGAVALFSLDSILAAVLATAESASLSSTVSQPSFWSAGGLRLGHPFRGVQDVKLVGVQPLDTSFRRGVRLRLGSGIGTGVGFKVGLRVVRLSGFVSLSVKVSETADVWFFRIWATACKHSYAC